MKKKAREFSVKFNWCLFPIYIMVNISTRHYEASFLKDHPVHKGCFFFSQLFFLGQQIFFSYVFSLLFFHYFCQPLCAKLGLVLFDKSLITSLKLVVMGCEKSQGPAAFLHQRVMNKFLLQL